MFRLIAHGALPALPADPRAGFDYVPIDHVARGIVALSETMDRAAGGTFHLVSGQPLSVEALGTVLADYPGLGAPRWVDPAGFDADCLPPRARRVWEASAAPYAPYFRRNPLFDDRALRRSTGLECPPVGPDYFRRLLDFCVAEGFLRGGA